MEELHPHISCIRCSHVLRFLHLTVAYSHLRVAADQWVAISWNRRPNWYGVSALGVTCSWYCCGGSCSSGSREGSDNSELSLLFEYYAMLQHNRNQTMLLHRTAHERSQLEAGHAHKCELRSGVAPCSFANASCHEGDSLTCPKHSHTHIVPSCLQMVQPTVTVHRVSKQPQCTGLDKPVDYELTT